MSRQSARVFTQRPMGLADNIRIDWRLILLALSLSWYATACTDADPLDPRENPCDSDEQCEGCLIDDAFHAPGEKNPVNDCLACDPTKSTRGWSPLPAGALCGDSETCDGLGVCGDKDACEQSCPAQDGWYDRGDPSDCCHEGQRCVCQSEEYRTHVCVGDTCEYAVTDENITADGCESCDDANPCTTNDCLEGACVAEDLPAGTACGDGEECDGLGVCGETHDCAESCAALDGWYDLGAPYDCCHEGRLCVCQSQEYRTHVCEADGCNYAVTSEDITADGCESCDDTNPCTESACVGSACVTHDLPEETPCGTSGVCDGHGTCSQGCLIEDTEFGAGGFNPDNDCQVCDPLLSEDSWTALDGVRCVTSLPCHEGLCRDGDCVVQPLCAGSDEECGCDECLDCTTMDGWLNVGDSYDSCDAAGTSRCTAQAGEYWRYYCDDEEMTCVPELVETEVWLTDCHVCDDENPCTAGICLDGECSFHPTPGEPCGVDGVCDLSGYCSDGCSIDGVFYPDGTTNPQDVCLMCHALTSQSGWSPRDGAACDSGAPCTTGRCQGGVCEPVPICTGTDEDCGCWTCQDCTAHNAWVNESGLFPTCDPTETQRCMGQHQSYYAFHCENSYCADEIVESIVNLTDCSPCDPEDPCQAGVCQGGACVTSVAVGAICGLAGACDEDGVCIEGCRIDEEFFAEGAIKPDNPCLRCHAATSHADWSPLPNGTVCGEDDACTNSFCQDGECHIENLPQSTTPTSITGVDSVLCDVSSVTLEATGGTHGHGAAYAWGTGGCGANVIPGASSQIYVAAPPLGSTTFWVRRSGGCGGVVTECATLEVESYQASTGPTLVSSSPSALCLGESAVLTASGGTHGEGAVFAWYDEVPNPRVLIPECTSDTCIVTPSRAVTGRYCAERVGGVCGSEARCHGGGMVVSSPSEGGSISSVASTVCAGDDPVSLWLSGSVGHDLTWYRRLDQGEWGVIGDSSPSVAVSLTTPGMHEFRVRVQNGTCPPADSATKMIEALGQTLGGSISGGEEPICSPSQSRTLTLSGHRGDVLRWERRLAGTGEWEQLYNASTTQSVSSSPAGTWEYRAVVANAPCLQKYSSVATVVVATGEQGVVTGGESPVCQVNSPGTLTLSGHEGAVMRWEYRNPIRDWTVIPETSTVLVAQVPDIPGLWEFRALVNPSACPDPAYSSIRAIEVASNAGGSIGISGATEPICASPGDSLELRLWDHAGSVIHWELRFDEQGNWATINTTQTRLTRSLGGPGTYRYRVLVENPPCAAVYSAERMFEVFEPSDGGTLTGGTTPIAAGNSPGTLTLSDHTGDIVRWEFRVDGDSWKPISHTAASWGAPALHEPGQYEFRVRVRAEPCPAAFSTIRAITVF